MSAVKRKSRAPEAERPKLSANAPPPAGPAIRGDASSWQDLLPPGHVLSTTTPAGIAALDPEVVKTVSRLGRRKPQDWLDDARAEYRLVIDPEFRDACRPLSEDERAGLLDDLGRRGCLSPLVAWWDGQRLLLVDGHHRFELCLQLDTWVEVLAAPFASRSEALRWIGTHQAGRRNLTPDEIEALLAKDYAAEKATRKADKKGPGAGRRASGKNGAHREPAGAGGSFETVRVPFRPEGAHRCKAEFTLLERGGKWYHFEESTNDGGGGESSYRGREVLDAKVEALGMKSFGSREACLIDAADGLLRIAELQGKKYWPYSAIADLRAWRASLPAPAKPGRAKKAAEVVAEKHGVSPATVKRAAKAQAEKAKIAAASGRKKAELNVITRDEAAALAALPDEEIKRAVAGGKQGIAAAIAGKNGRPKAEAELRREIERIVCRYLDTLDLKALPPGWDAVAVSRLFWDAVQVWRGLPAPAAPRKKAKPK